MQITYNIADWSVIGDGQWGIAGGVISQITVGQLDPQELFFNTPSGSQYRTVIAKITFNAVDDPANRQDGRVGISVLNNGTAGINLVYSDNAAGLAFLEDQIAWGNETHSFLPSVNSQWWFKASFDGASQTFSGKCWEVGSNEPEDWLVSYQPNALTEEYIYSGVVGNSPNVPLDLRSTTHASFSDFSIDPVIEPPSFKPWFKSKSHLLGLGLNNV
jgi:hypothetical protein